MIGVIVVLMLFPYVVEELKRGDGSLRLNQPSLLNCLLATISSAFTYVVLAHKSQNLNVGFSKSTLKINFKNTAVMWIVNTTVTTIYLTPFGYQLPSFIFSDKHLTANEKYEKRIGCELLSSPKNNMDVFNVGHYP